MVAACPRPFFADGATWQEAVTHAETVIDLWIETARDLGRPIPKASTGGSGLREYDALMRRLAKSGVRSGRKFTREEMNER